MQSLEHERAKFAYNKIKKIENHSEKDKYKSYAVNLGTLILTNGLLSTVAFYSKEDIHKEIIEWLKEKLVNENLIPDQIDFAKTISELPIERYILVTNASLSIAQWLKRFAEAILNKESKQ